MAKKIGVAVLVLLLLLAGVGFVIWQRLTALPDWYGSQEMIAGDGTPQIDRDWVRIPDAERPKQAPAGAEVYQMRNPHLRTSKAAPIKQAIKASRATYAGGELEGGAVLNLGDMKLDQLSPKERASYQKLIDAFPALTGRDVYVGFEGAGKNAEGKVALGPDTKLRVGDTHYTLKTAAKRLGMSEAELRAQIEKELARMDLELPQTSD